MSHAIFELETIRDLPMWAQVLLASRLTRRAALWLNPDTPPTARELLLAGCDAVDRCVQAGERSAAELVVIERAVRHSPVRCARPVFDAMYFLADAAYAAESSLDFEAAEPACSGSVQKSMAALCELDTLNPIQVRIFAAADLDSLRFACHEARVGRYDALGADVFARLAPVLPPDAKDIRPRSTADPADEFR